MESTSCFCVFLIKGISHRGPMRVSAISTVLTCAGLHRMVDTNPPLWVGEGSVSLGQQFPHVNHTGHERSLPAIACHVPAGPSSPLLPSYRELVDPSFLISALGCISGVNQGLGLGGTNVCLNQVGKDGVKIWKPESGRGLSSEAIRIFIFAQS